MYLFSSTPPRTASLLALGAAFCLSVPSGIGKPGVSLPLPSWEDDGGTENSLLSASLFPEPRSPGETPGTGMGSLPVPPLPPRDPNAPFEPLLEPLELQPLVVLESGIEPELENLPKGPGEVEVLLEDFQIYRAHPDTYLVNPQHLLSEPQEFDLTEFLDYHASESGIPIYLLVADGDQRMPDRFDLAESVDLWFPDSPVCVVLYYLGYPTRSEVILSPPLRRIAGTISGEEIREHASTDALVASDSIDQLSRFAVRTSIRMFWLEKRFRESGSVVLTGERSPFTFAAFLSILGQLFTSAEFYAVIFALTALIAGIYLMRTWWISRTGGRVYVFPEFDLATRLGAPHSGGDHIVVDFERRD